MKANNDVHVLPPHQGHSLQQKETYWGSCIVDRDVQTVTGLLRFLRGGFDALVALYVRLLLSGAGGIINE